MNRTPLSPHFLVRVWILTVICASALTAAPSGGPYGPISCWYEIPQSKSGDIFYVAPDGDPAASGVDIHHPTCIKSAFEEAKTDDIIVLRGGVYRIGNLITNQGITLQPYQNETPIFKGTLVASEWEKQKNGIWRINWEHLYPESAPDWWRRSSWGKETAPHDFNYDMLFVDGKPLKTVGWEGALDNSSFCIDYKNGNVYIAFDPTDHLIEITAYDNAITRVIGDCNGRSNDNKGIKIKGITFTQYAYRAIEIEGTEGHALVEPSEIGKDVVGSLFENVTISYCSRVAGYFRGDDLVIRNCLISHTGMEGIYVISSGNVLLENNIVTHTNIENLKGVFSTAIKIFNQCYNAICRNNLIIANENSSGIWYDVGNVNGRFYNNWIENTDNGFFFEISKGALCIGNVFLNCNTGIQIRNSCDVKIYHNTLINSSLYVLRDTRSAENDHFGWHPSSGPDVDERINHEICNNLLVADGSLSLPLLHIEQHPDLKGQLTDFQVSRLNSNVYVQKGISAPAAIRWSPTDSETGNTIFYHLKDFQDAISGFASQSRALNLEQGSVFESDQLKNLHLIETFSDLMNTTVNPPQEITKLLHLPANVGAY